MVELALKSGLRRGELANLETRDVAPEYVLVRGGKGDKDRIVRPFPPPSPSSCGTPFRGSNPGSWSAG